MGSITRQNGSVRRTFILLAVAVSGIGTSARASDFAWNTSAANQSWSVGGNWSPSGPPTSADNVVTPLLFGALAVNVATPQVANWTYNSTSNWTVLGNAGSGGTSLTITGNLTKSGSGTLTIRSGGSGLLSLTAANVALSSGILSLGGAISTTSLSNLTIGSAAVSGGEMQLTVATTSGTATITGSLDVSGSGIVSVRTDSSAGRSGTLEVGSLTSASSTAVIRVNGNSSTADSGMLSLKNTSGTATYAGTIINGGTAANVMSITKSGAGTQILSGNNMYSGGTTITGGTIVVTSTGKLGSGNVTVGTGLASSVLELSTSSAIANSATLTIDATNAQMILDNGINEIVGTLILGGVTYTSGTFGSTASSAQFKSDTFFSSSTSGIITVPEPSSALLAGVLTAGSLARKRRHRHSISES